MIRMMSRSKRSYLNSNDKAHAFSRNGTESLFSTFSTKPGTRFDTKVSTKTREPRTRLARTLIALLIAALALSPALEEGISRFEAALHPSTTHAVLIAREAIYHKVSAICSLWNAPTVQVSMPILLGRVSGKFSNPNEQVTLNASRWSVFGKVGQRDVHWVFDAETGRLHQMTVYAPQEMANESGLAITVPAEAGIVARHLLDTLDLVPAGAHLSFWKAPHSFRKAHDWRVVWKIQPDGGQSPYYVRIWIGSRTGLPQQVEILAQA